MRNGAAFALAAAPKPVCREWSAAVYRDLPEIDGLYAPSTMTGAANVVLFDRAVDAVPRHPDFSRHLADLPDLLDVIADQLGYSTSR